MELKRFCEKTLIFFHEYGTIQEITSILFKPRNPAEKDSDERPGHLSEGPPAGNC